MRYSKGFTLIELMIVVSIIGILAAIALPAYMDYTVRTRVSEALIAGSSVKGMMSEAFHNGGINSMTQAASLYNSTPLNEKQSKYIDNIHVFDTGANPWTIELIIAANSSNGIPSQLSQNRIALSPNVNNALPNSSSFGAIDWACTSATSDTASSRGMNNRPLPSSNPLPAKYAPSECR